MIKLLILDQEGTLYQNRNLLYKIKENTQTFFCKKLSIKKEDYSEWYNKNKTEFPNIFEALRKLNISVREYHSEVFDAINPKGYLKKNNNLFRILKKLKLPSYIVTSSSKGYSKRVLQSLGISTMIKKSISLSENNQNKIEIYNQILKEEKISPAEVCVIGDNWETDLKEAKERGFKTVLIGKERKRPFFAKSILELPYIIDQFNYPKINFFYWKDVENLIFKINNNLIKSKFYPDLIVGIARDGIIPAKLFNDINPGIDFKIVTCKRYYSGFSKKVPEVQTGTLENICSKKILLIDDVEDEGITIKSVKEKLLELGASQVKSMVLYSRSNESNADFIGVRGKGFAIFPWNRFQEILEFLKFDLVHSSPKEKLKVLTKMGFLRSDILYCMKRSTKGF